MGLTDGPPRLSPTAAPQLNGRDWASGSTPKRPPLAPCTTRPSVPRRPRNPRRQRTSVAADSLAGLCDAADPDPERPISPIEPCRQSTNPSQNVNIGSCPRNPSRRLAQPSPARRSSAGDTTVETFVTQDARTDRRGRSGFALGGVHLPIFGRWSRAVGKEANWRGRCTGERHSAALPQFGAWFERGCSSDREASGLPANPCRLCFSITELLIEQVVMLKHNL